MEVGWDDPISSELGRNGLLSCTFSLLIPLLAATIDMNHL